MKKHMSSLCRFPVLLAFFCGGAVAYGITEQTLTASEQRAPGTPVGGVFLNFPDALLSDSDDYVFRGNLSWSSGGVDVSSDSGVWAGNGTNLHYVAREKDRAPDIEFYTKFGDFYEVSPVVNSQGQVAFSQSLQSYGSINYTNDTGVWLGRPADMKLAAWEGTPASGLPVGVYYDKTFFPLSGVVLNDQNDVAFPGLLVGSGVSSGNDSALWAGGLSNLVLVAREGEQAAALPAGASYGSFGDLWLNNAQQVAFNAVLNIGAGGVNSTNNSAVFFGAYTNLNVLVREGDTAPGTSNAVFSSFEQYVTGPQDTLFLRATLKNGVGGVGSTNDVGLWLWNGSWRLLTREGSTSPALYTEQLDTLLSIDMSPGGMLGAHGLLVENGLSVVSTNREVIWGATTNGPWVAARTGDPAPGVAGRYFSSFSYYTVNDFGQVAFHALLNDGSEGLWASDLAGVLRLIAHEGDTVEVYPGDFRVIGTTGPGSVAGFTHDRRRGSAFNGQGKLLYTLRFTDGSSALRLADVAEIPRLKIQPSGSDVVLMWKTNGPSFSLQAAGALRTETVWWGITNTPNVVNGTNTVSVPVSPSNSFFRLILY